MVNARLIDIISSMDQIYKCIDLRTATVWIDGKWLNVLTVIRFTFEDLEAIEEKYEKLKGKWGSMKEDDFQIALKALHASKWHDLQDSFSKGIFDMNEFNVELEKQVNLGELKCNFYDYPQYTRKIDEWPLFEGYTITSANFNQQLGKAEPKIKLKGFPTIYTGICEMLQIKYNSGSNLNLVISAPLYAKIDDIDFWGQSAKVSVKRHKDMQGLRLNTILWKSTGALGSSYEKTDEIKDLDYVDIDTDRTLTTEFFSYFKWSKEFLNASPIDYLDARLIFKPLEALEIDKKGHYISRYLDRKSAVKNPFYNAFSRFCSRDEHFNQLLSPHTYRPKQKMGFDKVFERAVSWLLSLCGFNVIQLDEFEKLKVKGEKVEYDSVDILAYNNVKSSLFLVACTIGIPKVEEDITRLNEVKRKMFEELFNETSLQIFPIIFSSCKDLSPIKEAGQRYGVKVVDGNDTERLMNMVRDGEINETFILLTSA